jgi:hypothetical protein
VEVPVRHIAATASEPKPLKPQWQAPRSYFWFYIAGVLVVLAAVAFYLWRRWRKKRVVVEPAKPELPADFIALRALTEIENMGLLKGGEFKRYYTLVTDVLRHYLERRFNVLAMDRTTYETLHDLDAANVRVDGLEGLLQEADLVKFAKHVPEITDGKRAMEQSREIVARTAPRPMAVARGDQPHAEAMQ